MLKFLSMLVVLLGHTAACTTVTIIEKSGHVKVERALGFVSIKLSPGAEALLSELSVLGFVATPLGISIGYAHERLAVLSDSCKIVIWLNNKEQLNNFHRLFSESDELCPVFFDKETEK